MKPEWFELCLAVWDNKRRNVNPFVFIPYKSVVCQKKENNNNTRQTALFVVRIQKLWKCSAPNFTFSEGTDASEERTAHKKGFDMIQISFTHKVSMDSSIDQASFTLGKIEHWNQCDAWCRWICWKGLLLNNKIHERDLKCIC